MANNINPNYNLPQSFFELIEPYIVIQKPKVFTDPKKLIFVWQQALKAREQYPMVHLGIVLSSGSYLHLS